MVKRIVTNIFCQSCESSYKVSYHDEDISSLPKFCIVCSEELFDNDILDDFDKFDNDVEWIEDDE